MSAKKAEQALRAAADALFHAGWEEVSVAIVTPREGAPSVQCRALSPGRQKLTITRTGETFTIDRRDGAARVGKPIEADSPAALLRALAEEPPPVVRRT